MRQLATLSIVLMTATMTWGQETWDLRPLFRQGQTARYRLTQTELTRATLEGVPAEPQESLTDITGEVTWKVTDAQAGGGGTATMTIDTLSMKMTGPDGSTIEVTPTRASSEGAKPLQTWLTSLLKSPLEVQVQPDGTIGSVKGWKAIQAKAGETGSRLDEDYFREIAMDLAVLVGGKAGATVGSKWNHRYSGSHRLGTIDYDLTYEVAGVENIAGIPMVLINRTARLKLEPDLGEVPPDAPPMKFKTNEATQTGQIMFDTTRHEIVGINIDQTLEVQVSVTVAGRSIVRGNRETTNTQLLRIAEK